MYLARACHHHRRCARRALTIEGEVERTPTRLSRTLSDIAGCEVWLKFENLQFTASFKDRGALNKLKSLSAAERKRGVIAVSAAITPRASPITRAAWHSRHHRDALQFTPFNKIKHTRGFGAWVVLEGATLTESFVRAEKIAVEENLVFVHPMTIPR